MTQLPYRSWFCARYLSVRDTFVLVFMQADPVTIRVVLAFGSLISGCALLLDPDKFHNPVYSIMSKFGDERMWACYFILHFIGVHWRIFERSRSRPNWALAINTWGFSIWFISTATLIFGFGSLGIGTSMSLTMCCASAWALFRTGIGKDVVTL